MTGDGDELWRCKRVESPCVRICVVDPQSRFCIGCHRSIEEIAGWTRMTPETRRAVIDDLPARAAALKPTRRGGRAGRMARDKT